MNKFLKTMVLGAIVLTIISTGAFAQTLYAPDGRTIDVAEEEVELWTSVGWYTEPVKTVTIYAPDGREAIVAEGESETYLNWGWYAYPVCYVYAPDGRAMVIKTEEVDAYVEVGWYKYPVSTVYSLNGSVIVINSNELDSYLLNGWYSQPVLYINSYEGKTAVIFRSDLDAYKEVGWFELPDAYCGKIREYAKAVKTDKESANTIELDYSSINNLMVRYAVSEDKAIVYTLFDVDGNGVYELIFSLDGKIIDIYTLNKDKLIKLYENCYFGERSRLHVLYDGSLLSEGSNGATTSSYKVHAISGSGLALVKKEFCYYDSTGKKSYMEGFEYVSSKEYNKRLKKYMDMSIYDIFNWNSLFE